VEPFLFGGYMQPVQNKRNWKRHAVSPFYDGDYPNGDRDSGWHAGQPPIITGVSGAFEEGNEITLIGSNFSTKTSSQSFFTNFADDTIGERAAGFFYWNMPGTAEYRVVSDPTAPIGSGKIFRAHPIQQNFTEIHHELAENSDEILLEYWLRLNKVDFAASPDLQQIKLGRILDGTGQDATQNRPFRIDLLLQADGTLQITTGPEVGAGSWYQKLGTSPLNNTDWYKFVYYMRKGALNTATGERFLKVGSINEFTSSNAASPRHFASPLTGSVSPTADQGEPIINHTDATAPYFFRRIVLPYFQRLDQETISDVAQVFINTSKECVILGDASTYVACNKTLTHRVRTNSRAHNEINFRAHKGFFNTGPIYAYAVNQDGLFNSNGALVRAA
jgi:hypothetical protein